LANPNRVIGEQLSAVMAAAEPLAPADRGPLLEAIIPPPTLLERPIAASRVGSHDTRTRSKWT
jgi:hypothetical protein